MATHSSILAWRIPMDRGAWQATVHGVSKSQTWLSVAQHILWSDYHNKSGYHPSPHSCVFFFSWWEILGSWQLLNIWHSASNYRHYVPCCADSLQLCLTLCNPMDCSPPGSSVYGILQARILECVATYKGYDISPSLSDLLHSVWQSLGPSMLPQMALFHSL